MVHSSQPFRDLFFRPQIHHELNSQQLSKEIARLTALINERQPNYSPFVTSELNDQANYRKAALDRNIRFVVEHFRFVEINSKIRVLDIGSNNGYVPLTLGGYGFDTVGLEVDRENLLVSQLMAQQLESKVRFFGDDILDLIRSGEGFVGEIDAICLFNVVHQWIINFGLDFTKSIIAWLSKRVDVLFIQLARREDYVSHGLDHHLPWRPEEVLEACDQSTVQCLDSSDRPVYRIVRRKAVFDHISVEPDWIQFSASPRDDINRKYYGSRKGFIKVFRDIYSEESRSRVYAEINALLKLSSEQIAPRLIDWLVFDNIAVLEQEFVEGERLNEVIRRTPRRIDAKREIASILNVHARLDSTIGFHNDVNLHNIIMQSDNRLKIIDFELSNKNVLVDPIGTLLWVIKDLLSARLLSHSANVHQNLIIVEPGAWRVSSMYYPSFDDVVVPDSIAALIDDLRECNDWSALVRKWDEICRTW